MLLSDSLKNIDWDFPNSSTKNGLHSIHPYPAKFIAEIPRELIKTFPPPKGTAVFDPFCGSGTTLVEAQQAGYKSYGIDLNPIACLISKVKTQRLDSNFLCVAQEIVIKAKASHHEEKKTEIPNLDHWFSLESQKAIAKLLYYIAKEKNYSIKNGLNLALSAILVRTSNQDSDTRYAAVNKNISEESVYTHFATAAKKLATAKASQQQTEHESVVLCKNVLDVSATEIVYPIGLAITSPPYPNAYEYWLYHKYRMYWLGFDPLNVKAQEIGARAHYFKKNHPTEHSFLMQMSTVIRLIKSVLVVGGHACIVIGRSRVHGNDIDNTAIIEKAAELENMEVAHIFERRLMSSRKTFNLAHANISKEHIVVMRKR